MFFFFCEISNDRKVDIGSESSNDIGKKFKMFEITFGEISKGRNDNGPKSLDFEMT